MYVKIKTEKQIVQVSQLARRIWFPFFSSMIEPDTLASVFDKVQSVKAITDQIKNGYSYYFIHSKNKPPGDPVGYFAYILKPETSELFLSKLYLIPSARRCGYGKRVMTFLTETALKHGCSCITLIVFDKNKDAISAYRKMGFVCTGSIKQDIGNGLIVIDYTMKKEVINYPF